MRYRTCPNFTVPVEDEERLFTDFVVAPSARVTWVEFE